MKVMAQVTHFNVDRNRPQLLDTINGVISMLFRTPALRNLYFNVSECTTISQYHEKCNSRYMDFMALVLPPNVSNVREIRVNNMFYEITDKRVPGVCQWKLVPGRNYDVCRPLAERLPKRLLEKDFPACGSRIVTFRSDSDDDCGKMVGVRYLNLNGDEVREDIALDVTARSTTQSVLEFLNITFPDRRGWMVVETAEGDFLGKYHPSIFVPSHNWFRLEIGCPGLKAEYRGITEPLTYVFDTDFVPFSDKVLWRLAYKAYEHLDSMELEPGQVNALARIYSQLSAVSDQEVSANLTNFNTRMLPEAGKALLSTGRLFAQRYSNR